MEDSTTQDNTQEFPAPEPQDSVHKPTVDLRNEIKKGSEHEGHSDKFHGIENPTVQDK